MKIIDNVGIKRVLSIVVFLTVLCGTNAIFRKPPKMSHGTLDWRYPDYIVNPLPDCPFEGVFTHPRNCTWYYRCHQIANIKFFQRFYFQCTAGTVFSDQADQCVFPHDSKEPCKYAYTAATTVTQRPPFSSTTKRSPPSSVTKTTANVSVKPVTLKPVQQVTTMKPLSIKPVTISTVPPVTTSPVTIQPVLPVTINPGVTLVFPAVESTSNKIQATSKPPLANTSTMTVSSSTNKPTISKDMCTLFTSLCKSYEFCTENYAKGTKVLCEIAYADCTSLKKKVNLCQGSELYDQNNNVCISQLCILVVHSVQHFIPGTSPGLLTVTTTNITTVFYNNSTLTGVGVEVPQKCFLINQKCRPHNGCNDNGTIVQYLCHNATAKCSPDGQLISLCQGNDLFDPFALNCATKLCPFNVSPTVINSDLISSTNALNGTSISESTLFSEVTQEIYQGCFTSISDCKIYDACDFNKNKIKMFLCTKATSTCTKNNEKVNLCSNNAQYDPDNNLCVVQLCILKTVSISYTVTTSSTLQVSQCFNSYSQCRSYDTCDSNNKMIGRYLCVEAIRKCLHDTKIERLCAFDYLYDPYLNKCITQLCPVAESSTLLLSNGTEAAAVGTIGITGTPIPSLLTTIRPVITGVEATGKCSLTYTQCRDFEFCLDNRSKGNKYLCSKAFYECPNDKSNLPLCALGQFYDPKNHECIVQLCVLITRPASLAHTVSTSIHSNSTSLKNTTTVTEVSSGAILNKCFFVNAKCRPYNTCNGNGTIVQYLCINATAKCLPDGQLISLCQGSDLFDPYALNCATKLCPFNVSPTVINSDLISSTNALNGTSISESTLFSEVTQEIYQGCFTSISDCKIYDACDFNKNKIKMFLCTKATSTCTKNNEKVNLCSNNAQYDPDNNLCVVQLCILKTVSISYTVTTSSTLQVSQCFNSYSQCRSYDTCDSNNKMIGRYLCVEAIRKCLHDTKIERLCAFDYLYDPYLNKCITQLCPVAESSTLLLSNGTEAAAVGTIGITGTPIPSLLTTIHPVITGVEATGKCSLTYTQCRDFEFCLDNRSKGNKYLCSKAFYECPNDKSNLPLCPLGQFYDPKNHECIVQLCVLITRPASLAHTVSTSIHSNSTSLKNTTTVTEVSSGAILNKCFFVNAKCRPYNTCNGNGTIVQYLCINATAKCLPDGQLISLCQGSDLFDPYALNCATKLCPFNVSPTVINSDLISSTNALNGTSISESTLFSEVTQEIYQGCFTSISDCKIYDACDFNKNKIKMFLCSKATSTCTKNNEKVNLCSNNAQYDPDNNLCVAQLCILKTVSISYTVTASSTLQVSQCFNSYSQCRSYDTCDSNNKMIGRYLCVEAIRKCLHDTKIERLCAFDYLYDPYLNKCITQLCPVAESSTLLLSNGTEAAAVGTIGITGTPIPSLLTTIRPVITGVEATGKCSLTYTQCRDFEFCLDNRSKGNKYLCSKAFYECPNDKSNLPLCALGQFYDPKNHECIVQLCVLITKPAFLLPIVEGTTYSNSTSSTVTSNIAVGSNVISPAPPTSASGATITSSTSTITPNTTSIEPIDECFSSYAQCQDFEFCLGNGNKGNKYLCLKAFYECPNDKSNLPLCSIGQLYDPKNHVCIVQLCILTTRPVSLVPTTSGTAYSNSTSSKNITSTTSTIGSVESGATVISSGTVGVSVIPSASITISVSGATVTSSPSTVIPLTTSIEQTGKCFSSYAQCRDFEICLENGKKGQKYLCSKAFYECPNDKSNLPLCSIGQFYDPKNHKCIVQLCILITRPVSNAPSISETTYSNSTSLKNITATTSSVISTVSASSEAFGGSGITSTFITTTATEATITSNSTETPLTTSIEQLDKCFSSYAQCRDFEFCLENGNKGNMYLCSKAFYDCPSEKSNFPLCSIGQFYDPLNHECVVQLCILTTRPVSLAPIASGTTYSNSTSSKNTSSTSSTVESVISVAPSTSNGDVGGSITSASTTTNASGATITSSFSTDTPLTTIIESIGECFSSYAQCRDFDFCLGNGTKGKKYLCSKAFYECPNDKTNLPLCSVKQFYDPKNHECVVQLCVLITSPVSLAPTVSATTYSNSTILPNISSTPSIVVVSGVPSASSEATITTTAAGDTLTSYSTETLLTTTIKPFGECFSSYAQCQDYDFCLGNGNKGKKYLCSKAFYECPNDKSNFPLCSVGQFYDPKYHECIVKLCVLITSPVSLVPTLSGITYNNLTSSTIHTSTISTIESVVTGVPSTSSEAVGGSGITSAFTTASESGASISFSTSTVTPLTSITEPTGDCFSSYAQCQDFEFCLVNGSKGKMYLCSKAFYECPNDKSNLPLCSLGQYYDPKNHKCVVQLCILITRPVAVATTISNTTYSNSTSSKNITSTTSSVGSLVSGIPSTSSGNVGVGGIPSGSLTTSGSGATVTSHTSTVAPQTTTIEPIGKCFSSYSQCQDFEFCLSNGNKGKMYLCSKAFYECPQDKSNLPLCSLGQFYNPKNHECVVQLCILITRPVALAPTISSSSYNNSTSSKNITSNTSTVGSVASGIPSTSSGNIGVSGLPSMSNATSAFGPTVTSHTSTVTTQATTIEPIGKCFSSYSQCQDLEFCLGNGNKGRIYLCSRAFYECPHDESNLPLCSLGHFYNPKNHECVVQLCILITRPVTLAPTISSTTYSNSTSSKNITSTTSTVGSVVSGIPSTSNGNFGASVIPSASITTSASGVTVTSHTSTATPQTTIIEPIGECFSSYSQCRDFEFCLGNGNKGKMYLCSKAFYECPVDKSNLPLCSLGQFYDPKNHECVVQLCILITRPVVLAPTIASPTYSNSTSSKNITSTTSTVESVVSGFPSTSSENVGTSGVPSVSNTTSPSGATVTSLTSIVTLQTTTIEPIGECFSSYAQCRDFEFCLNNGNKGKMYLCSKAYYECPHDKSNLPLCSLGQSYDPKNHECVVQLCILITRPVALAPTISSPTYSNSTSSKNITSTTSTVESVVSGFPSTSIENVGTSGVPSVSNTTSPSGATVTSPTSIVTLQTTTIEPIGECFSSYAQCRDFEFCLDNGNKGKMYLCSKAYYECPHDKSNLPLCSLGQFYDPKNHECVVQLCILITRPVALAPTISSPTYSNSTSSKNITSTTSTVESVVSGFPSTSIENVGTSGVPSVSNTTSPSGATVTSPTSIVTLQITTIEPIGECFSSYAQCRDFEFCLDNGNKGKMYLCSKAYYECSHDKSNLPLCSLGQFYNPKNHECVVQLCILITRPVALAPTISSSSYSNSTSFENITSTTSPVGSVDTYIPSTSSGNIGVSGIPSMSNTTSAFGNTVTSHTSTVTTQTTTIEPIGKCFSSYSQCQDLEFCLGNGNKGKIYLCSKAFYECPNDKSNLPLCSVKQFYDPKNHECVVQLCVLITSPVSLAPTVLGTAYSNSTISTNISSTASIAGAVGSGVNSTSSEAFGGSALTSAAITTTATGDTMSSYSTEPPLSTTLEPFGECFSSYAQCQNYEFCLVNGNKGNKYLCLKAFYECPINKSNFSLCSLGQFYDPESHECVLQLCVLITRPVSIALTVSGTNYSNFTSSKNITSSSSGVESEASSVLSMIMTKCFFTDAKCRPYNICNNNSTKIQYLCANATAKCLPYAQTISLCQEEHLFDPSALNCVAQLCPYNYSPTVINSKVISTANVVSATNISNSTLFYEVTSEVYGGCFTSISDCKIYESCDLKMNKTKLFLCSNASSTCTKNNEKVNLCSNNAQYDPDNNLCVIQLCILKTISISTSVTTSGSFQASQCSNSYSQCKSYKACDSNNNKISRYLCVEAIRKCSLNTKMEKLCAFDYLYDPFLNKCISKLCPIAETSLMTKINITDSVSLETVGLSGMTSASGATVTSSSSVTPLTTTNRPFGECFSSYAQCQDTEFCLSNGNKGNKYLCSTAFYECPNDQSNLPMCSFGQLYDPKTHECVVQLCVLITKPVSLSPTISGTTYNNSTSSKNITSSPSTVGSLVSGVPSTSSGVVGESGIPSSLITTIASGATPITTTIEQIEECFSSYAQCQDFEFCLGNGNKGNKYLCSKAFYECPNDISNIPLCAVGQFYDPKNHECVVQLCVLITKPVSLAPNVVETTYTNSTSSTNITSTPSNVASAVSEVPSTSIGGVPMSGAPSASNVTNESGATVTSSSTTVSSVTTPIESIGECFSSYAQCRDFEFCLGNENKGKKYLCLKAFYECPNENSNLPLCSLGQYYDPKNHECVVQLCILITRPVALAPTISNTTYSNSTISKNITSTTTTFGSVVAGVSSTSSGAVTVSGNLSPFITTSDSGATVTPSSSSVTPLTTTIKPFGECFSSYAQCQDTEFCLSNGNKGNKYLCSTAFYECPNDQSNLPLCSVGQLYDPKTHECVVQLCVLITKPVSLSPTISGTTYNNSTSSKNITSSPSTVGSLVSGVPSTSSGVVGESGIPSSLITTIASGATPITTTIEQIEECFSSYAQCRDFEFCLGNGNKGNKYLCSKAFYECPNDISNIPLCAVGQFYDPKNHECVVQLCVLITKPVSLAPNVVETTYTNSTSSTNITSTPSNVASAVSEVPSTSIGGVPMSGAPSVSNITNESGATVTSSSTTVSSLTTPIESISECFSSYAQCRDFEFCLGNGNKGKKYLCLKAFYECPNENSNLPLCSLGQYYDPKNHECVVQLCILITRPVALAPTISNITYSNSTSSKNITSTTTTFGSVVAGVSSTSSGAVTVSGNLSPFITTSASGATVTPSSSSVTPFTTTIKPFGECFSSYAQCQDTEFCLSNGNKGNKYLCSTAFYECPNAQSNLPLCSIGQLYDPKIHECVVQLCVLITKPVSLSPTISGTTYNTTSSKNKTSTPSSVGSLVSGVPSTSSGAVGGSGIPSSLITSIPSGATPITTTIEQIEECFSSYAQCRDFEFCLGNGNKGNKYLCSKAFYECPNDISNIPLCGVGQFYDPKNHECVVQLCVLITKPVSLAPNVVETTYTNSTSSKNITSTPSNVASAVSGVLSTSIGGVPMSGAPSASNITSESGATVTSSSTTVSSLTTPIESIGECFSSYAQCQDFEFCLGNGNKGKKYLCLKAFYECPNENSNLPLCSLGQYYDPKNHECVVQLCILITRPVAHAPTISNTTYSNSTSSKNITSTTTTFGSVVAGVSSTSSGAVTVSGNLSPFITTSASGATVTPSSSSVTPLTTTIKPFGECFSSYAQCQDIEFCLSNGNKGNKYLCSTAFYKCPNDQSNLPLCSIGQLYDPKTHECIVQLCVLITKPVSLSPTITGTTYNNSTSSKNITSTPSTVGSLVSGVPSTSSGVVGESGIPSSLITTIASGATPITTTIEQIEECFSSYAQCRDFEFCLGNGNKGNKYLCSKAFYECPKDISNIPLCAVGQFYDPKNHECVVQLCVLITKPVSLAPNVGKTTSTNSTSSTNIISTPSNVTSVVSGVPSTSIGGVAMSGAPSASNITNESGATVTSSSTTVSSLTTPIESIGECFSSYAQCRDFEFCLGNGNKGKKYLCLKAFYECPNENSNLPLCSLGQYYDPKNHECVVQLCILITRPVAHAPTISNTTYSNSTSSKNITSTTTTFGSVVAGVPSTSSGAVTVSGNLSPLITTSASGATVTSSSSSITPFTTTIKPFGVCFSSYAQCRDTEFCLSNGNKGNKYLCSTAFYECPNDQSNLPLCSIGQLYDPKIHECVVQLCVLITKPVSLSPTISGTSYNTTSSKNKTSTPSSVGSLVSGVPSTSSGAVGGSGIPSSLITAISSGATPITTTIEQIDDCFSSYAQCRDFEFCLGNGNKGNKYLCSKAFYECPNDISNIPLCAVGQFYDPKNHECVVQLCVLITKPVSLAPNVVGTTYSNSSSSTNITSTPSNVAPGGVPMSGASSASNITNESGATVTSSSTTVSSLTTPIESIGECFSSYAQCRDFEFCLGNGNKRKKYLCLKAFYECPNENSNLPLCSLGQYYDPKNHECVVQLCILITRPVALAPTISNTTYSNSTSSKNITSTTTTFGSVVAGVPSTSSGAATVSGNLSITITTSASGATVISSSSVTPLTTIIKPFDECLSSYAQCQDTEFCLSNGNKGNKYLCLTAFYECPNGQSNLPLCSIGQLYDPKIHECVVQLCVLITKPVSLSPSISGITYNNSTSSKNLTSTPSTVGSLLSGVLSTSSGAVTVSGNHSASIATGASVATITSFPSTVTPLTTTNEPIGECFSSYAQCRDYEFCLDNSNKGNKYLCSKAFFECPNVKSNIPLCSVGQFYDPKDNECILQLCVLITRPVSLATTYGNSTSSQNITTTTISVGSSVSGVSLISNGTVGQGGSPLTSIPTSASGAFVTTSSSTLTPLTTGIGQIGECFSSYAQCRDFEFCLGNGNKGKKYLCSKAFYDCPNDKSNLPLCSVGQLYDPKSHECVEQLCVLITRPVYHAATVSGTIYSNNTSSKNITIPTSTEESVVPGDTGPTLGEGAGASGMTSGLGSIDADGAILGTVVSSQGNNCFYKYSECKSFETCDSNNYKTSRYLCLNAFRNCSLNIQPERLCLKDNYYDYFSNQCIAQLCPIMTSSVSVAVHLSSLGIIPLDGNFLLSNSSSTTQSTLQSGASNQSEKHPIISNGTVVAGMTSFGSAEDCFSTYALCQNIEFCLEDGSKGTKYLCSKAFYECKNEKLNLSLCAPGQFYDPTNNECVVQLCVLITHPVYSVSTESESLYGNSTSTKNVTTTSTVVTITYSNTTASSELQNFVTTNECITSYTQCSHFEYCLDSYNNGTIYLCAKTLLECSNVENKQSLCSDNQLFDPKSNLCVIQLCVFETVSPQIEFNNSSFSTSNETISADSSSINGSTSISFDCYSSYARCKGHKFCDSDGIVKEGYFCSDAYYICSKGARRFNICNESTLYDPHNKNCIVNLCPLQVLPTENSAIVEVSDDAHENENENVNSSAISQSVTEFPISNRESINYTELVFCQLKYDFCKNVYNYNDISSLIKTKYLCQCQETCHFRREKLQNSFLCYPPLFEAKIGNCSFVKENETCLIGFASSSLSDGGSSFSRFKDSLSTSISFQTANIAHFRSKLAAIPKNTSDTVCSRALRGPKALGIQKRVCSDILICENKAQLQLYRVKSLCSHYVECLSEEGGDQQLNFSSCPNNQFYSYDDATCLPSVEFQSDKCALYMGGEPSSSILRLFSERLPYQAKTFLNTRLIGL